MNREQFGNANEHYRFYTFDTFLERQKALGFKRIYLFGGTPHVWIDAYQKDNGHEMRRRIEEKGLQCRSRTIETTSQRYALPRIGENDGKSLRYYELCYAYAVELGVPYVVTAANGFCLDEPESVRNMRLLEMLREQKRQAEAMGVRLVVSAKTGDATNPVQTLSDVRRIIDALGTDAPDFACETAGFYRTGETLEQWIDALGSKLVQVNLTNTLFDGGRHAWGDGYMNLDDFVSVLDRKKYKGEINCGCMVRHYMQKPWVWDERTAMQLELALGGA